MSTGVSTALLRKVWMMDRPSRLGSMRSTISTSYWPSSAMRLAFLAVGRLVGDMADLAERLDQVIGRVAIVLNDEKAHDVLPWSGSHVGQGAISSGPAVPRRIILFQALSAISIQNANQAANKGAERRSAAPPPDH